MGKLMLIGDSIRGNYRPWVIKLFADEAAAHAEDAGYAPVTVTGPEENCRFALYTLNSLRFWYDDIRAADVIHWNNGIWDIDEGSGEKRAFTSLTDYLIALKRIYGVLRRENSKAKIIFATTTITNLGGRYETDTLRYNAAAVKLMTSMGAEIDDLYSIVIRNRNEFICEDKVHLNDAGAQACAEAVAASYKAAMKL